MMSLWVFLHTFMIKVLGFISKYAYRLNSYFGANINSGNSVKKSLNFGEKRDFDGNIEETEYSVFAQSNYQFLFGESVIGYVEDVDTVQYKVQEMFMGSDDDVFVTDQSCDSGVIGKAEFLGRKLDEKMEEFDEITEIFGGKECLELESEGDGVDFDESLEISRGEELSEHEFEERRYEFDGISEFSHGKEVLELEFEENKLEFDEKTEFFRGKDSSEHEKIVLARGKGLLENDREEETPEFDELSHGKDSPEHEFNENMQELDEKSELSRGKDSLDREFEESMQESDEESEISQGEDLLERKLEESIQESDGKSDFYFSFNLFNPNTLLITLPTETEIHEEKEENITKNSEEIVVFGEKETAELDVSEEKETAELDVSGEKETAELDVSGEKETVELDVSGEKETVELDVSGEKETDKMVVSEEKETDEMVVSEEKGTDEIVVFGEKEMIMDYHDFSYEVEFFPKAAKSGNPETSDHDVDEYIELGPEIVQKSSNIPPDFDSDIDDDYADALLEHQNLVEQMKMELNNCRIGGLPVISEEFESPKMLEDLKPLKIDQKLEYKDMIGEIQKFYKCYLERMRKLDILNYQTLHAISFLQLKESEVFTAGKKKKPVSTNFTLPKTWSRKVLRIYADPMHKSIVDMHMDLESVYVGQLCLSWEILSWLYVKAGELLVYDRKGTHSYNRVAEEFQQFQVLVNRFMEDEPFQGHRVQNYVENRGLIRSLLHVPTIRDDCLKDTKGIREKTDAITLEMLTEIIRESMLIFREFLCADKRSANVVTKGISGTKVDNLQDPTTLELFVEIVTDLQKKERRIRETTRSENCIVKKLKKNRECRLDHELFASQVELRLVSRVLGLQRLTRDQLLWCQTKLGNINFVRRKVHLEPSFLLFPC